MSLKKYIVEDTKTKRDFKPIFYIHISQNDVFDTLAWAARTIFVESTCKFHDLPLATLCLVKRLPISSR